MACQRRGSIGPALERGEVVASNSYYRLVVLTTMPAPTTMRFTVLLSAAIACATFHAMPTTTDSTQGGLPNRPNKGFVPFHPPLRRFNTNVFCLHVQAARGEPTQLLYAEGDVTWKHNDEGGLWRTYGKEHSPPRPRLLSAYRSACLSAFNSKFRETFRLWCHLPHHDDFDVWFGWLKAW